MLRASPRRSPRWLATVVAATVAGLGGPAAAAGSPPRLTLAEARAIAGEIAARGGLRVPVDATVLAAANRILARKYRRREYGEALARLGPRRYELAAALRRHGVPAELLAIPLHESRAQVLPEARDRWRSAGMWQFIPATARKYGLRVDAERDERLDPAAEVEAAGRYLAALHASLGEWPLAIAAFNQGRPKVRRAVAAHGTREAGRLVARGALNGYSSSVLAVVLLIERPDLLR